jgi:hypothetical protein
MVNNQGTAGQGQGYAKPNRVTRSNTMKVLLAKAALT